MGCLEYRHFQTVFNNLAESSVSRFVFEIVLVSKKVKMNEYRKKFSDFTT